MKRDVADRILAQLDQHGWTQDRSVSTSGQICASEAVCRALGQQFGLNAVDDAECELGTKAKRMFPGRGKCADLIYFNDHPQTSEEDLRLVIKHCVED